MRLLAAAVVSTTLLAGCSAKREAVAPCPQQHWVSVWAAAPTEANNAGFEQQTLRMIVTPRFGGDRVRIRLSARLGRRTSVLDHVTIALRRSGARLVPGTLRTVTFGGRRSVVIGPRADVASDAVSLPVKPFRDVAVSVYAAAPTARATEHRPAIQSSYVTAPGVPDAAADVSGRAFSSRVRSWPFLVGLDVAAPRADRAVVALGDSLTDGSQFAHSGAVDPHSAYPDALARLLLARPGFRDLAVVNASISGNNLLHVSSQLGMLDRLGPDVIAQPGAASVIVLGGTNDIVGPRAPSAQQVIDGLAEMVARLHLHGMRVVLGTIPPRGAYRADVRKAVNRWIRTPGVADGLADFDAVLRAAPGSNRLAPEFDRGDHIHPNAAGYAAMARAVSPSQLAGAGCRSDNDTREDRMPWPIRI